VTALIEQGAKVNAQNVDGYTPLHIAHLMGNTEVASVLRCHQANEKLKSRYGEIPSACEASRNSCYCLPFYFDDPHAISSGGIILEHSPDYDAVANSAFIAKQEVKKLARRGSTMLASAASEIKKEMNKTMQGLK
jgi:ankyrin repeat protein